MDCCKSAYYSQDRGYWTAAQGLSKDGHVSFLWWIIHPVLSYFVMAYSLQLVRKESPGSFKQVIKKTIYYLLPLESVNFICCGLMMRLLSMLIPSNTLKVNHSNS